MSCSLSVTPYHYGEVSGEAVSAFKLTNSHGLEATILDYGAILASVITPDSQGQRADIVLGYDDLEDWLKNPSHYGATIGRFGNRIAGGKFSLDGVDYQLACNNEPAGHPCHLHGGLEGFDKKIWLAETFQFPDRCGVVLTRTSPAGEEGYPGELKTKITYTLTEDNELLWVANATTDAPTIVNLVNHSYWNLSGDLSQNIGDHSLQIHSDSYLPANSGLIPTGEVFPIAYTPLDFTEPTLIGDRIDAPFEPLELAAGYDQAFLLKNDGKLQQATTVTHPNSGRSLTVSTNQPAIHFYTGNYIDSEIPGKNGKNYSPRCAFCLETENYPDAPNNPHAPSSVLRPGETYSHIMSCKFGW